MTEIKGKRDAIQPMHYALPNGREVIDVIALATYQLKGVVAYDVGNTVKYEMRKGKKKSDTSLNQSMKEKAFEDIKKARWYLNDACSKFTEDMFDKDAVIDRSEFSEKDVFDYLKTVESDFDLIPILILLLTPCTTFEEKKTTLNRTLSELNFFIENIK